MNSSILDLLSAQRVGAATRALGAIVFATWLGDYLLGNLEPGLSVGVYGFILGSMVLLSGERSRVGYLALAFLAMTAVQSAVELSLTNISVGFALIIVLVGEAMFQAAPGYWARWSEAARSVLLGPFRLPAFAKWCAEERVTAGGSGPTSRAGLIVLVQVILPALAAMMAFVVLLGAGNAVVGNLIARITNWSMEWIGDLSMVRTALWIVWFVTGVALFFPALPSDQLRWFQRAIPRWPRKERTIALWQSGLLLVAVNLVFFVANTADAFYLWASASLPAEVSYSQFVHQGVHSLILAVVLAAGILVFTFQQEDAVAGSPTLKGLALLWIAQNGLLIASVFLRLKLYVDALQLTELRVYVGCFLSLVAIGFCSLAVHVIRGMEIRKLVVTNLTATFALFFALQFADVGTWVANWNVARWQREPDRSLDLRYLQSLGAHGWPALATVAASTDRPAISAVARQHLMQIALSTPRERTGWRSIQFRRDRRLDVLRREFSARP